MKKTKPPDDAAIEACCELYSGAHAWVLTNIKRIKPFPVKGHLGLYDVESTREGGA